MDGLNDVFIAGKRFFTKRRETINVYDLDRLTNPDNYGRRIDDTRALRSQIDNVSNYSLYGNVVYYTRNDDSRVWKYTWTDNKKTGLGDISFTPGNFLNYAAHRPMKEKRNVEYQNAKKGINEKITGYQKIGNSDEDKRSVESKIILLGKDKQNENGLYNAALSYLSPKYTLDKAAFRNFMMLAEITGNKSEAVSIITLLKENPVEYRNYISEFYSAHEKLSRLTPDALKTKKNEHTIQKIEPLKNELTKKWTINFEQKMVSFNKIKNNMDGPKPQNNDRRRITDIDYQLNDFLKDTPYINEQNYDDWKAIKAFYDEVVDKIQIMQFKIAAIEQLLVDQQKTVYNSIKKDYYDTYTSLTNARTENNNIEAKFEAEKKEFQDNKAKNLNKISAGIAYKYRTSELFDKINTNIFLGSYDPSLIDYCIITDSQKIINGFKLSDKIIMNDFMNNTNNSGEDYRLIKPAGYPLVNINKNSVFVLNSKKQISAFDTTKPDILENKIKPLTIGDGVFYMIQSTGGQFIVTNTGDLLQLSIKNGEIISDKMGTVTAKDTVLVTGNDFYIFSQNGTVKNRSGRASSIKIQACNDPESVYDITIDTNGFVIQ